MRNTGTIYSSTERSPTVLPEMAELLPPLTGEQLAALETDILKNGCYSPVIVNEDMVVIDGHNRQRLCQQHGLPYQMAVFSFESMLEAKQWALDTQKGRRNLDKWELGKIALRLKPDIEARAKENMSLGGQAYRPSDIGEKGFANSQSLPPAINTTKELCADFALHDKGDGNPHAHVMLTIRPLRSDGKWGPKCRKVYDLDSQGNRIPDGKGGWKNHREDTTDWNNRDNAEKWRAAWAAYANRALEAAGRPERIDHRSYERQGIEKIPSIHMGVAASQMERKGIQTEKGNINRQIAADNKLLKELKARITRIYNWSKERAQAEQPQSSGSLVARLYEAQAEVNRNKARYRSGKIKALQENAKLLAFLQGNGINSMQELYEKVSAMNKDYYDLRGQIVGAERRLAVLDERLEMWAQYEKFKPIRQKLDKAKPGKREKYQQEHRAELAGFDVAAHFLKSLKESGEAITPKAWRAEAAKLTVQKDADYQKMYAMRDEIKAVENLRKAADRLAHEGQHQQKEQER